MKLGEYLGWFETRSTHLFCLGLFYHDCSRRQILRHFSQFSTKNKVSRRFSWNNMPYLLVFKKQQNLNCRLLQIIGDALWVKNFRKPEIGNIVYIIRRCNTCSKNIVGLFSSPEPKAHGWGNSITVTPASLRPSSDNIFKHLLWKHWAN